MASKDLQMYDGQTFCQPCFTANLAIEGVITAKFEQAGTLKVTFTA